MQTIKNQIDSKTLTQNIFILKIEIKLIDFLDFCSNLSCSFFCSLFNKKFDTIVTKKNLRNLQKKRKRQLLL